MDRWDTLLDPNGLSEGKLYYKDGGSLHNGNRQNQNKLHILN
jgi:hypothetical protein